MTKSDHRLAISVQQLKLQKIDDEAERIELEILKQQSALNELRQAKRLCETELETAYNKLLAEDVEEDRWYEDGMRSTGTDGAYFYVVRKSSEGRLEGLTVEIYHGGFNQYASEWEALGENMQTGQSTRFGMSQLRDVTRYRVSRDSVPPSNLAKDAQLHLLVTEGDLSGLRPTFERIGNSPVAFFRIGEIWYRLVGIRKDRD